MAHAEQCEQADDYRRYKGSQHEHCRVVHGDAAGERHDREEVEGYQVEVLQQGGVEGEWREIEDNTEGGEDLGGGEGSGVL